MIIQAYHSNLSHRTCAISRPTHYLHQAHPRYRAIINERNVVAKMGRLQIISESARNRLRKCKATVLTKKDQPNSSEQNRETENQEPQAGRVKRVSAATRHGLHAIVEWLSSNKLMATKQIGPSTPDALRLPSDLVSSLTNILLTQRESRLVQSKIIAKLKALDTAVSQLDRRAIAFEERAEELRFQDASANSEDIETMRESARMVRATQDLIRQRRQGL